ncbi:MAG: hypothetical protein P8076_10385 [Gammaproteobacteria bacterium]|jgi:fatty acid desaturase
MLGPSEPDKHLDRVILLFMLALLLFASPLVAWWSAPGRPWFLPYLLWLLVIVLGLWLQWRRRE